LIIGFHYHIPAVQKEDGIYMPGYIGVFIDGLANECNKVVCYLHAPLESEVKQIDYKLKSSNIELVNIGKHINVFKRVLKQKEFIKNIKEDLDKRNIDIFLMRVPSPLVPFVTQLCKDKNIKYSYLIVGDYVKNLQESKNIKPLKRFILNVFYKYNKYYQDQYARHALLFTNNPMITKMYEKLKPYEIRTTTLKQNDFYYDEGFYKDNILNIIYAGRIEPSKGIIDIVYAVKSLKDKNINVIFHLVGWDPSKDEIYLNHLVDKVKSLKLEKNFIFHGKKQVGIELFTMYRQSDIFISSTRGDEGFPRTIWEAMANSAIVIATKAGSIPIILKDNEHALLVEKYSPQDMVEKVLFLLDNPKEVKKIRKNAFSLAQTNTIEKQSIDIIDKVKEYIDEK